MSLRKKKFQLKGFIQTEMLFEGLFDKMAKWLRKLNANALDSDRMVSNPVFVMLSIRCMEK